MSDRELLTKAADKLASFVATRDRRCAKASGWGNAPISEHFARLMRGETVRVGGRASCGPKVDPTWVELTAWREVVRKARSLGLSVDEIPVKHGNGWATKCGGFWDENDYRLTAAAIGDQP
jgi:hypothetical protein